MTGSLARRAAAFEAGVWRSLAVWVLRRRHERRPGEDVTEHGYARTVTPVFWLFIAMSAVEVVVAHLLIPWRTVQVVSLVLGAWGLLWMLGMLAALHAHPHLLGRSGLRVRHGFTADVAVPWSEVASVSARHRDHKGVRSVLVEDGRDGGHALVLSVGSETSVDVVLSGRVTVPLPLGAAEVTELRVHADDPRAFVAAARTLLATSP